MPKLLKDPLVHFLLIGAALFLFSAWRGESIETGRERLEITAVQVEQTASSASLLQGRPPTREQLEALLEPVIRDEVLYREALALGLDVNDDEVRRRLIEKMLTVTQDLADPEPESPEALRAFYAEAPERFEMPERVSFEQVFLSPSRRGDALESDAAAVLAALRGGADPLTAGDRTPLRGRYEDAPSEQVAVLFGDDIAQRLFTMDAGEWQGPFRSDFGVHLVRLVEREERRVPPFEEVVGRVAAEFAAVRRQEANEAVYRQMRDRYDVVVQWPDEAAPAGQ